MLLSLKATEILLLTFARTRTVPNSSSFSELWFEKSTVLFYYHKLWTNTKANTKTSLKYISNVSLQVALVKELPSDLHSWWAINWKHCHSENVWHTWLRVTHSLKWAQSTPPFWNKQISLSHKLYRKCLDNDAQLLLFLQWRRSRNIFRAAHPLVTNRLKNNHNRLLMFPHQASEVNCQWTQPATFF